MKGEESQAGTQQASRKAGDEYPNVEHGMCLWFAIVRRAQHHYSIAPVALDALAGQSIADDSPLRRLNIRRHRSAR